jgi:hypothetical protein
MSGVNKYQTRREREREFKEEVEAIRNNVNEHCMSKTLPVYMTSPLLPKLHTFALFACV